MNKIKVVILNDTGFDTGSFFGNVDDKIEGLKYAMHSDISIDVPKKRGRKKKPRVYFTQETENYIVKYNNELDVNEKHKIYEQHIKYAIEKLAENIINTFKFTYISDQYIDIKSEVVSKMILEMDKYNPSKGKAFSYFSIITKNYLIILNNDAYKELKITKSIDSTNDTDDREYDILDETYDKNIANDETQEFIKLLIDYWDVNISSVFKKSRDMEIAYAIVELLRNVNVLEFFNKKALYLLIREMTGYKTQYITRVLNKMASNYDYIKNMYLSNGEINSKITFFSKS